VTFSFNPLLATVVTHTHAKDQDQRSVCLKDRVKECCSLDGFQCWCYIQITPARL